MNVLRGEWPSGLYSLRKVTEVKLDRVRSNSGSMGDLGGLTSQLTSSSFGRDVKLGVPCQDASLWGKSIVSKAPGNCTK